MSSTRRQGWLRCLYPYSSPTRLSPPPRLNALPKGVLGYAQVTAGQAGITTTITDLTGLSVTVTCEASRRIRVTGHGTAVQRTAIGLPIGYIREGSTTLSEWLRNSLGINEQAASESSVIITPTAGSHTYKLSLNTTASTVDSAASATRPPSSSSKI